RWGERGGGSRVAGACAKAYGWSPKKGWVGRPPRTGIRRCPALVSLESASASEGCFGGEAALRRRVARPPRSWIIRRCSRAPTNVPCLLGGADEVRYISFL